jgi:hypothetical protein
VVSKVEEKGAPAKTGDQLKIAKAEAAASAAEQTADEAKMRQRIVKEEEARAEELKKTNEKLARELAIVSQAATLARQQAKAEAVSEQLKAQADAAKARAEADGDVKEGVNPSEWALRHWKWVATSLVLPMVGWLANRAIGTGKSTHRPGKTRSTGRRFASNRF